MIKNEKCETNVLLPLANPETSGLLIDLVNRLNKEETKVLLMKLVNKEEEKAEALALLDRKEKLLKETFIVSKQVRTEKRPDRGILKAARECRAGYLVLGWHGNDVKNSDKGRVLDPILRKAPCSVLIGKSLELISERPRQILVPLTGVKESDVQALKTAESLLDPVYGGRITILYFNQSPIRLTHINFLMTEVLSRTNIRLDGIASNSEKPVKTTILQSREFDVTVSGLIEPWLFRRGKASFSERIALESTGAMIMVRTPRPVRSRINFFM
ncbi:MAG: universal stress protein [Spirochaetales bacterium]|nr:universal stress protein [Spirochaetales bacterium]